MVADMTSVYKNICMMIHPGRVGSTVVAKSLGNCPIYLAGEIHNELINNIHEWHNKLNYLDVFNIMLTDSFNNNWSQYGHSVNYPPELSTYMFEYKPFHNKNLPTIDKAVLDFEQIGVNKFIFLYRKNYIRRYVSYIISSLSGIWHTNKADTKPFKIEIDVNNCSDPEIGFHSGSLIEALDHYYKSFIPLVISAIKHKDELIINYEEHVENDISIAYESITHFLDICSNAEHADCVYVRQNGSPLSDIIINYKCVLKYLEGTEYIILLNS